MPESRRRQIIGEDGELHGALPDENAPEAIYCTRCGTANGPDSSFCRRCGQSLEEQEADMVGVAPRLPVAGAPKAKHDAVERLSSKAERREKEDPAVNATIVQVVNMLLTVGMGITALVTDQGAALIGIVIAWLATEALRSGNRHVSTPAAITGVMTGLIIAGMVITALVVGQGAAIIPILIAWAAVTAIRGS